MGIDLGKAAGNFLGGLAGGIGEGVGKVAGKIADWVPGPGQYRRNKIHELTKKMLDIQRVKPFDNVKYNKLRAERDKLEDEAVNTGS